MNSKHRKTLAAMRSKPTRSNIRWADMEKLAVSLGAEVVEGPGSSMQFRLNGFVSSFHRPHPGKEAKRYAVVGLLKFLLQAGVIAEEDES